MDELPVAVPKPVTPVVAIDIVLSSVKFPPPINPSVVEIFLFDNTASKMPYPESVVGVFEIVFHV